MGNNEDNGFARKLLTFDGKAENFMVWQERFKIFLLCKQINVTEADVAEPKREEIQVKLYCEIIMHLDNALCQTIISIGEKNGFKVWTYLVETYGIIKTSQIVTLWKEFVTIHKSSSETVVQFISRFELVIYKLQSAKETLSDNLKIAILLNGLPGEYESFIAALQFQTIDYKTLKVKLIERSLTMNIEPVSSSTDNSEAIAAKASYQRDRGGRREIFKCTNCLKTGHKLERCWAPGGPLYRERSPTRSPARSPISGLALNVTNHDTDIVIFDSGCTEHILTDDSFFTHLSLTKDSNNVESGDGSKQRVEGRGSAAISVCDSNGHQSCLQLEDALYVPTFKYNLISIDILCTRNNTVQFTGNTGVITLKNGHYINLIRKNGLYCLRIVTNPVSLLSLGDWHNRLGHADQSMLKQLPNVVDGVSFKTSCVTQRCQLCTINKISQTTVRNDTPLRSQNIRDLVFTDACGPFVDSINGNKYIISFIDDHSRVARVYFMKKKSESLDKFKLYVAEFGMPKALRSDNAKEYFTPEMTNFIVEKGVGMQQQSTAPYSPHQNGVAERYWRTINDMARTMLDQASLPDCFWVRAVETAVFLRNRLITAAVKGKTPYEVAQGKKPDLSHVRVFGSDCVVKIERHRTKMEQKGRRGIFMGYDERSPVYVVYLCDERKFVKSRNVVIFENSFTNSQSCFKCSSKSGIILVPERISSIPDIDPVSVTADVYQNGNNFGENESDFWSNQGDDELADETLVIDRDETEIVTPEVIPEIPVNQPVRRSTRTIKQPSWQQDFHMGDYPLEDTIFAGIALKSAVFSDVPNTYKQALESSESKHWEDAMQRELTSLRDNDTWRLVPRPIKSPVIKGRWVFAKKCDKNGELESYKARYVAKGFSQIHGENYDETFAPTAKMSTIRMIIALSAQKNLILHQIDVKTAFLNSPLDEEIFVEQPVGVVNDQMVCKLNKCIYGLKQASRVWNKYLDNILRQIGFIQSSADPCLYHFNGELTFLMVWVDDIIVISFSEARITMIISHISKRVKIDDRGTLTWFLGMSVEVNAEAITLSQKQYILDVLEKWGMADCKPVSTPMISNEVSQGNDQFDPELLVFYRQLIGNLLYISTISRPDISYSVNFLSRHCTKPTKALFVAAKRVLRYLKGSAHFKLIFRRSSFQLTAYTDSDWAGDLTDRKSTSGLVIKCNPSDSPIHWRTIRQQSVALSSCEAEYMALAACIQELIYVKTVFLSINCIYESVKCPVVYCDNQGCIALAKNPVMNRRSRHIDIKFHFLRDVVEKEEVKLSYLQTDLMPADVLTKPLVKDKLCSLIKILYGSILRGCVDID